MKEMRTETVRIRRLSPGLVFRIDLGSKSGSGSCGSDTSGFVISEISAIDEALRL